MASLAEAQREASDAHIKEAAPGLVYKNIESGLLLICVTSKLNFTKRKAKMNWTGIFLHNASQNMTKLHSMYHSSLKSDEVLSCEFQELTATVSKPFCTLSWRYRGKSVAGTSRSL